MEQRTYRSAIVTTDDALRDRLRAALRAHPQVDAPLEIVTPLTELAEAQLRRLQELDPELVLLDLSRDAATAIRFARYLTEQNGARRVVGMGPDLGSETLLAAMRAGVCEYLRQPVEAEELDAALDRVQRSLGGATGRSRPPGRVFTFFAAKGGVGTTTLAANVAIELHRLTRKPTLLVDLDVELGEAAVLLGLEPRHTLVDLARNVHRLDPQLLGSFVERHESGVHVLAAPIYPMAGEGIGAEPVRVLLGFVRQHYGFVVVDTARTTAAHTIAALEGADRVLAVTQLTLSSLRNFKRYGPLLARIHGPDRERVRLIINRHEPASALAPDEVEEALELRVHRTLCDDPEAVARATANGRPLVLNGSSPLALQIRELAADLAGIDLDRGPGAGRLFQALAAPVRRLGRRFGRSPSDVIAHE